MRLSERLRMVAGMVPHCNAVADVGCDHAYLSVWLLREGIASYAYACDVRPGPLSKAAETIRFFHMGERATTVLCDGLSGLSPGDASVIVMAGMGGELMTRLLADGDACVQAAGCLVLQPQSDRESVRRRVYAAGFVITDEQCVFEDGKYYTCFQALPRSALNGGATPAVTVADPHWDVPYEPAEYRYGRIPALKKDMTYLAWLTEECEKKTAMVERLAAADTALASERLPGAAAELAEIAGVIRQFL